MTREKIIRKIRDFFKNYNHLNTKIIKSVYVISSLARRDFIVGVSDIDLLVIFEKGTLESEANLTSEELLKELKSIFSEVSTSHFGDIVDIAWEIHGRYKESKIKLFNYFWTDLKENNILVYGEDIISSLHLNEPESHKYREKIYSLIEKYKKCSDLSEKNLFVGEAIRNYLWLNGIKTLNKFEIIEELEGSELKDFFKFYKRYLKNSSNNPDQEDLNEKVIDYIIKSVENKGIEVALK